MTETQLFLLISPKYNFKSSINNKLDNHRREPRLKKIKVSLYKNPKDLKNKLRNNSSLTSPNYLSSDRRLSISVSYIHSTSTKETQT